MQEKVALVTGASSGFGLLTSILLAQKGWVVYAGVRDLARAEELMRAAREGGLDQRVKPVILDVTNQEQIQEAVNRIMKQSGRIDALVNNAGYAAGGFVEEVPLATWRDQFETNFFGVIAVTQAVLPAMRQQQSGRIVFVSSVSGRIGFPALSPYVASKHALEGLGESLRLELAGFGIQVSIIEPGPYRTPIWRKSMEATAVPQPGSPYFELYKRIEPMLKQSATGGGDPNQVAQTIYRALTDPKPKLRYLPGSGEKKMMAAKSYLPSSWIERAALRMIGVKRRDG
jgi:NAD(P)-dependent dehydrogenase (short-subunit alcohol dehydrogenase family)